MPYGICKVCGCTDNDPCSHPDYGTCWWVDDTHELCSHCADPEIANDLATEHCINSANVYNQSVAEVLVCKNCRHWHKADGDVDDDNAYGGCDQHDWGSYGSDPMCADFDEREEGENHE